MFLLLLMSWSTQRTPTAATKRGRTRGSGPPALPLTPVGRSLPLCFPNEGFPCLLIMSSPPLRALISYLLLCVECDRGLVLSCRSDLTPTRAIKLGTVGTRTTSGSVGRQIWTFFIPPSLLSFSPSTVFRLFLLRLSRLSSLHGLSPSVLPLCLHTLNYQPEKPSVC